MSNPHASLLIANMSFGNYKVGARVRTILHREGILTLDQLLNCTEHDLRKMKGLGIICLTEIKVKLQKMNLALKDFSW